MKLTKFTVQSCCGKSAVIYKTDRPLESRHIAALVNIGFNESIHFTRAGILYVDNSDFIVTGPIGSDRLTIKCKQQAECTQKVNNLEGLLQQME
jgi:hypothetical protein